MKKLLMTAGAAILAMATAASAASISIVGGVAGDLPGGTEKNHVLDKLGIATPFPANIGGNVVMSGFTGTEEFKVEVMGYEAGLRNSFALGAFSYTKPDDLIDWANPAPLATGIISGITDGFLNFTFSSVAPSNGLTIASVTNGGNAFALPANFAAAFYDGALWLFYDDGASGPDDNHDDLVIRISAVPLPAGGLLLLTGLGALAFRRRKTA